jgi:TetR/AcrR family transcriptional regulator, transcriptional repressor for nem operon
MARPKEFDRESALEAAMRLFWAKGYDATSTDDLRHAIGIGRQSLYDTFGGKRALYLEALRRYQDDSVAARIKTLRAADSPLSAIEQFLVAVARETPTQRAMGCMGVRAICDFGTSDPDVSALGKSAGAVVESALEDTLRNAKAKNEVRSSVDVRAAARFLQAILTGLKIAARAGSTPSSLRAIAEVAVDGLRKK